MRLRRRRFDEAALGERRSNSAALAGKGPNRTIGGAVGQTGARQIEPSSRHGRHILAEGPYREVLEKLTNGVSPSQKLSHGHGGLSFFLRFLKISGPKNQ